MKTEAMNNKLITKTGTGPLEIKNVTQKTVFKRKAQED